MPTVRRARTIAAAPEDVWAVVSDPHHLPRWWPGVARVEEATPKAWTKVMTAKSGRAVRADFSQVAYERPRRFAWKQELVDSPFERILSESRTAISLERADGGGTRVEIEQTETPRGMNRFGSFIFRLAARKRLDQALDGLDSILGERD